MFGRFSLKLASGGERLVELHKERSSFGRASSCDLWLDEPGIEPLAGWISFSMGEAFLQTPDGKPVDVDGEMTERKVLGAKSSLLLGRLKLTLLSVSDIPSEAPPIDFSKKMDAEFFQAGEFEAESLRAADFIDPSEIEAPRAQALEESQAPAREAKEEPSKPPALPAWPDDCKAWARLVCLSGLQKGNVVFMEQSLFRFSDSGCAALFSFRKKEPWFTWLEGSLVYTDKNKISDPAPFPLPDMAKISIGRFVGVFQINPAKAS